MSENQTLLGACLLAEKVTGGTIHQYLPRLRWAFDSTENDKFWLIYQTTNGVQTVIGSCTGQSRTPEISPSLATVKGFTFEDRFRA